MNAESGEEPEFLDGIEPLSAEELAGYEQVTYEGIANGIGRISITSLNEELTVSLECAKIMGWVVRGPDHPMI